jgi:hypothetical protein
MEIIVKINDAPSQDSYKDGDIVQAFTLDEVYYHHAQNKCNVKNFGLDDVTGNRSPEELLIKFLEKTKTYKFERLNSNEVKKTNLITDEVSILNKTPNADGERIDVHAYLVRRLKKESHLIFGKSGREYWYGKERNDIDINAVWNDIETHTDFLQSDHTRFPFSDIEKRTFLAINTSGRRYTGDSFTRVELSGDTVHVRQEIAFEDPPEEIPEDYDLIVLARRKWFVPYWDLTAALGTSVDKLRNPNHICDCRKAMDEREHIDILTFDKVAAGIIT